MQKLLRQIKRELKAAKHCAVYEEELSRIWPDGNQRESKVARFAGTMDFGCAFIVMAYARFSIKNHLHRQTDRQRTARTAAKQSERI